MNDLSIAWISAAVYATTGYGKMCKQIVSRLISRYQWNNIINVGGIGSVAVWGGKMNYPVVVDGKTVEITTVPTVGQLAGRDVMNTYQRKYTFDLIIAHWDCFAIDFLNDSKIPVFGYIPVDAPFTRNMYNNVSKFTKIIAFSKFGYDQLLKWFTHDRLDYIPHGIDTKLWTPSNYEQRQINRKKLDIKEDAFVICTNAANAGERKMLPLMIDIFKKFHENHPNSVLVLFTSPNIAYPRGYDLRGYANEQGLSDCVIFPKYDPMIEPWTDEEIRDQIYGISDVYLTTSMGEGFGIPVLEAQSCGIPVIATNNSALTELVEGHGWLIDVDEDFHLTPIWIPTLQTYTVPKISSALKHLEDAYNNTAKKLNYGELSREFALNYDWDRIIPMWDNLLQNFQKKLKI